MKEDAKREAISIVDGERRAWEMATVFVTPKVGFNMRVLIESVRKNFWGVFDKPIDKNTGRKKVWLPMTQRDVEIVWKNADVDLKDMMFRARTPEGIECAELTRYVVRNYLDYIYFGETLDETTRQLIMDGTVVWKTWEENGKMKRKTVDLLNVYIDPTEENIQSAYRFTERSISTPTQIRKMTGWENTDVAGQTNLDKNNARTGSNTTTAENVDIWEMWGKIPKWMISKKKKDKDSGEEIDGHIVVSGLESGGGVVHLIEENKKKDRLGNIIKPYEEARLVKISGRWYGLGIPEREMALQEWLNISVNLRINRAYIAQLGLFKIRQGSGITPQMLANLASAGAVPVNNMGDIEQFNIQGPNATDYQDEQIIREWAQAVTQSYPIASGESLPASQTATASAIQSNASKSSYSMIKDAIEFFLTRWMDRHALPIIAKSVSPQDIVRVVGEGDGFKELAEKIASYYAEEELNRAGVVDPVLFAQAVEAAEGELRKRPQLFIQATRKIVASGLETRFYTNNESLDTQATVQNLLTAMQIAPEYRESYVEQIADLQGLSKPKKSPPPPQQGVPQDASQTIQDMTQSVYGLGQGNSATVTQG
jgi:hypothetical protein